MPCYVPGQGLSARVAWIDHALTNYPSLNGMAAVAVTDNN
ncbi:hypothetical protein DVDV_0402 [Desulfovibrio sp. DV]|nr:hypothetical protein DVDV_0402 [Desulfovibrio sp. DV]